LQVALQFEFALHFRKQRFSVTRSDMEIASQAEYAGSIPVIGSVIGSTSTSMDAVRTVRTRPSVSRRCHNSIQSVMVGWLATAGSVPSSASWSRWLVDCLLAV